MRRAPADREGRRPGRSGSPDPDRRTDPIGRFGEADPVCCRLFDSSGCFSQPSPCFGNMRAPARFAPGSAGAVECSGRSLCTEHRWTERVSSLRTPGRIAATSCFAGRERGAHSCRSDSVRKQSGADAESRFPKIGGSLPLLRCAAPERVCA